MPESKEPSPYENRRSWVRIMASYCAIALIFFMGPAFVVLLYLTGNEEKAFDLFHVIFPVATGIISYWFASRDGKPGSKGEDGNDDEDKH